MTEGDVTLRPTPWDARDGIQWMALGSQEWTPQQIAIRLQHYSFYVLITFVYNTHSFMYLLHLVTTHTSLCPLLHLVITPTTFMFLHIWLQHLQPLCPYWSHYFLARTGEGYICNQTVLRYRVWRKTSSVLAPRDGIYNQGSGDLN